MSITTNTFRRSKNLIAGSCFALTLALGGCASTYGTNTVSSAGVGEASTVYQATVTSVREVTIAPDNSVVGTAAGAALGGLGGSELGGGTVARTAGAIGGAVLGGVAGNAAGKALNTRKGYAYIVSFANGDSKEIVQGADIYLQPGTSVNAIASPDGWKLIPQGISSPPPQ